MAIELYESHLSRDMDGDNVTVRYVVTGTTDPKAARNAVLLDTTPTLFDRIRKEPRLTFEGGDLYRVEIPYGLGEAGDAVQPDGQEGGENAGGPGGGGEGGPGESGEGEPGGAGGSGGAPASDDDPLGFNVTGTTGGGTAHILLSKETKIKVRVGGGLDPANTQNAIGITNGTVEGCDIVTSGGEFSVTRKRRRMTLGYLRTLLRLTGKTNKAVFWGFAIGELLYLGCDFQGSNQKGWTVTHKFRFAENQKNPVIIQPNVTVAEKKGHEYVWCIYKDKIDTAAGEVYPLPTQIFVERVYDEGDFKDLQIGA
jgi:hypothetical protein